MRAAIVVLVSGLAFVASVSAETRKVLVLPVDGNAPAAQRTKINASIAKLAKASGGTVTIGDATFNETAAAVGCMPEDAGCAATVMATLSVDELVWGTANTADGSTTIVVKRSAKGSPTREQTAVIGERDGGDSAEPSMATVFQEGDVAGPTDGSALGSGELGSGAAEGPRAHVGSSFFDTRERKLGVGLAAGGAVALIIGISQWMKKSDLQDEIDNHPKNTVADFEALTALEDRAGSKAMWGNIFVAVGVGLAGAGGYFLYKDRENRNATITPAPVETGTGAKILLEGRW